MPTLADVLRQGGYIQDGQIVRQPSQTAQALNQFGRNVVSNAAQNLANQRADIDAALTMGPQGIQVGDKEAFARQLEMVPNMMGSITKAQKKALDQYIESSSPINDFLRGEGPDIGSAGQKLVSQLDEIFSKAKPSKKDMIVYRAVPENVYSRTSDLDKGFISTTTDRAEAEKFLKEYGLDKIVEIKVPKGSKYVEAGKLYQGYNYPNEVILPRNTTIVGEGTKKFIDNSRQLIPEVYQEAFELERRTGMRPSADELSKIQQIRDMMQRERVSRREILEKELSKAKK